MDRWVSFAGLFVVFVLVGTGPVTGVDAESGTVTVDVDKIMEDGRGLAKLREIRDAIESAIEANEAGNGGR